MWMDVEDLSRAGGEFASKLPPSLPVFTVEGNDSDEERECLERGEVHLIRNLL